MLARLSIEKGPAEVTIELILQVSRSVENRLSGTVRSCKDAEPHHFSGTLELMRVFEDLVPQVPQPVRQAHAGWSQASSTKPRGLS